MRFPRPNLSKSDWLIVFLAAMGYIGATLIGIFMTLHGMEVAPWIWPLIGLGFISSTIVSAAKLHRDNQNRQQLGDRLAHRQRTSAEMNIRLLLRLIASSQPGQSKHSRANLMLINSDNKLHVKYHYGMDDAPDLKKPWGKYQGCCGYVWGTGKQYWADLSDVTEQELKEFWKLDAQQRRCTSDVKSIVSVPLKNIDNPDIIIGVLNSDSDQPLSVSRLDDKDYIDKVLIFGEVLARLVKLGQLV